MEVRPRVASGVLLHVPSEEGYFTVYIHRGEVRPLAGNLIMSHTGASPLDLHSVLQVFTRCCVFSGGGSCERWGS